MADRFGTTTLDRLAQIALLGLIAGIVAAVVTQSWAPLIVAVFGLICLGRYVYRLAEQV
jgi:hypothetical protein